MSKKIKKLLLYIILAYTFIGVLILPPIIKSQLTKSVNSSLNATFSVESVYFNPFLFKIYLNHISLKDKTDGDELLYLDKFLLDIDLYSLFYGAVNIHNFYLKEPRISLVMGKDHKLNFQDILIKDDTKDNDKKEQTNSSLPRIIVGKIEIDSADIHYKDFTKEKPFTFSFYQLDLKLEDFDTKNIDKTKSSIKLFSKFDDNGVVDIHTKVVSLDPIVFDGDVDIKGKLLYSAWRYMQDSLNIEVADAKIFLNANYHINLDDDNSSVVKDLKFDINNLRIKPKHIEKDMITLENLYIHGAEIKPFINDIHIHNFGLKGLSLNLKKDKNKQLNLLKYTKIDTKEDIKTDENKTSEAKAMNLVLDRLALEDIGVVFEDNSLTPKVLSKNLVDIKEFSVNDIKLDTKDKTVDIKSVLLDKLSLDPQRYKNATLNFSSLVDLKKDVVKTKKVKSDTKQTPYRVKIKEFNLRDADVKFTDNSLKKRAVEKIDHINVTLKDIDSKEGTWLDYKLSSRVNKVGMLKADGKLKAKPLEQRGVFSIKNITLKNLTPYIQESSYVEISDGRIYLNGKTIYMPTKKGADLLVESSFKLNSFFVNDSRDDSLLLSLNDVDIKSFTYEMNPDRFYIEEMGIDSFYVNAKIDKNKVLNFAKLSKHPSKQKKSKKIAKNKKPFPVTIAKISFVNGSAEFSDYSIPIKFKTNIHDLVGDIYALSNTSGETSYINMNGDVDKYGLTKLAGSIDTSNPKQFMDLDLSFKNLDLSSMSGYSSSFAGYEIDAGKLYLDLNYKIINSKLESTNNLMIKKIKLGKEVEDENVTKLPLGFVIGLLEDNDGVIDIDLPIDGDVDNPDFKYSKVVWNVFTNLITKAVTAPFKFLASAMGLDGDDLEYIEFEPARVTILPTEREKLDNVAKIMIKKPKVLLSVGASYDKKVDKLALQKDILIAEVIKMSGEENIKNSKSALNIELLEELYSKREGDDKLDKFREKIEKESDEKEFKQRYTKALISLCLSIQKVPEDRYIKLAKDRQVAILTYLNSDKGIEKNRIILGKVSELDDDEKMVKTEMEIQIK